MRRLLQLHRLLPSPILIRGINNGGNSVTMHWNSSLPDLPQVLITGKKTEKGENDKMIYTFTVTCGLDKATALFGIYGSDGRFLGAERSVLFSRERKGRLLPLIPSYLQRGHTLKQRFERRSVRRVYHRRMIQTCTGHETAGKVI